MSKDNIKLIKLYRYIQTVQIGETFFNPGTFVGAEHSHKPAAIKDDIAAGVIALKQATTEEAHLFISLGVLDPEPYGLTPDITETQDTDDDETSEANTNAE